MTAYCAIVLPIVSVILPISLVSILLYVTISTNQPAGWMLCIFFTGSAVWGVFLMRLVGRELYSWGMFDKDGIRIVSLMRGKTTILYKNCKSCGIGYYFHSAAGTAIGSRVCYMFLSYEPFDESYRTRMNMWKPSDTRIKIEFNKKTYNYLMSVLPESHAKIMKRDYEMYVVKSKKQKQTKK